MPRVLDRLARPYDPVRAVAALLGMPEPATRRLVGAVLATADEAEDLLDAMPRVMRSLAIAHSDTPIRCAGEIRGPVLWGETIGARAAVAGDPGVVVCAAPERAFDTPENRVLVAALTHIADAGHDAVGHAADPAHDPDDVVVGRARHNAHRARRYLDHQALAAIERRPDRRGLLRTRTGNKRATYAPALALLARAEAPLGDSHLAALADAETVELLGVLGALLDAAEAAGSPVRLRVRDHAVVAGALRYAHPRSGAAPAGITVDGEPVRAAADVAAAAARLRSAS
jgi:hypothetical protein